MKERSKELLSLEVLQALRVRGFVTPADIARTTGLTENDVHTELAAAQANGHATLRQGRVSGWTLTAAGREAHAQAAAAAPQPPATLQAADAAFVALNTPMKALCTRWQTENQPPDCAPELARIDAAIQPILAGLADAAPRFPIYGTRLAAALARFQAGDTDALLRPLSQSYHDIWMELHQDLLLTLGRARTQGDGH